MYYDLRQTQSQMTLSLLMLQVEDFYNEWLNGLGELKFRKEFCESREVEGKIF
jgi:hypothetical protein